MRFTRVCGRNARVHAYNIRRGFRIVFFTAITRLITLWTEDRIAMVSEGDSVRWEYGTGTLGTGTGTGTVIETGLSKFGHDDVIKVSSFGQTVHIRPKDLLEP